MGPLCPDVRHKIRNRRSAWHLAEAYTVPAATLATRYFLLHAKVVVADRRVGVVSSANLTHYGLKSHLELGVSIRGPDAQTLAQLLNTLISSNYVIELSRR